ncbi:MAG: Hsp20/alpha crystallin family protein [Thermacetogeniaceae bacterium]|jgi:HSP20 family protein|nr:Hsp20/alpha crystallin family protein [Thermoanaerobacterales bacterium]NLN21067.1 Hsp20/alpha crystallin family protein [Syntrophomonadaceae bacterium]HAF16982.1 Hsp20/alpha crystallin family protein [Peptococcaceae bacterium]
MSLIRRDRDYLRELSPMRETINNFIEDLFTRFPTFSNTGEWRPSIDLIDRGTEYVIRADLPGYAPENVTINVLENNVQISGQIKEEKDTTEGNFELRERSFGSFTRSIPLPVQIKPEEARARYRNGLLEITLPKVDAPKGHILNIETE